MNRPRLRNRRFAVIGVLASALTVAALTSQRRMSMIGMPSTSRKARLTAIGAIAAAALTLGCGAEAAVESATAAASVGSTADQSALNGTYRFAISDADLRAHGVTNPGVIHENHGLFTWVLRDGRWQAHQRAANISNPNFAGSYKLRGARISFVFRGPGEPDAPPAMTMRWKLAGGKLRFTVISGGDAIVRTYFTAHAWQKIA